MSSYPIDETEPFHAASAVDNKPLRITLEEQITDLFEELHAALYRYLLMLARDRADTEDFVQEAFLRLHRQIRDGQRIENVRAWLFRVGYNLYVDRGRRSLDACSLSDHRITLAAEGLHQHSTPTPEQRVVERERKRHLASAVEALPQRQRECLYLRREGFRYREIGDILGIRESTVIDHLRRAIERLSRELHDAR